MPDDFPVFSEQQIHKMQFTPPLQSIEYHLSSESSDFGKLSELLFFVRHDDFVRQFSSGFCISTYHCGRYPMHTQWNIPLQKPLPDVLRGQYVLFLSFFFFFKENYKMLIFILLFET